MNHESFKLLLMTLMMIKLYKITVFMKNTKFHFIGGITRNHGFCTAQNISTVASENGQIRPKQRHRLTR